MQWHEYYSIMVLILKLVKPTEWKRIFVNHISEKELTSKIHKVVFIYNR